MIFISLIPQEEELKEYYDNYSGYVFHSEIPISPVTVKRYNQLLDYFEKYRKNNAILDFGCGAGIFLKTASDRGWHCYGIEKSTTAADICRKMGINIINENDVNLSFDIIVCIETIEHLKNPSHVLSGYIKHLRKGGLFYCTTPNFNSLGRFFHKSDYFIFCYPEHLMFYTPKTLNFFFKRMGLIKKRISVTGISFRKTEKDNASTYQKTPEHLKTEIVRQIIENNRLLLTSKYILNTFLSISGLGATIKAIYEKRN